MVDVDTYNKTMRNECGVVGGDGKRGCYEARLASFDKGGARQRGRDGEM